MRKVVEKSVRCVQVVLGECESSCSGRSPRVNESCLNHLKPCTGPSNECSPIFYDNLDLGPRVEMVAVRGEFLPHDRVRDDRVDLHTRNLLAAGSESPGHIPASARADDQ